ncbi:hypothetical protein [Zhenpiania hominis]
MARSGLLSHCRRRIFLLTRL